MIWIVLTNDLSQFYAIYVVRRNRGRIIFYNGWQAPAGLKARQLKSGQTLASTCILAAKCLQTPANAGVSWLGTSINLKNSSFPRRRESNSFADQPFAKLGFPPVDGDAIRRAGMTGFLEVPSCGAAQKVSD
jgi:hypothetical protein